MDDLKLVYLSRLQGLQELVQSHESNANSMFQKFNNTSSDHAITLQDVRSKFNVLCDTSVLCLFF